MTAGLGLRGSDLLVYARVFSFCQEETGTYFESAESCAEFLNMSERQVRRSLGNLVSRDLIVEAAGTEQCTRSRAFALCREAVRETFDVGGSSKRALERYASCEMLALDDLGKESSSRWSLMTLFTIVNAQVRGHKAYGHHVAVHAGAAEGEACVDRRSGDRPPR